MKNDPKMPADLIPYWDMDAPKIPDEPRDVSSAACIASALYESVRTIYLMRILTRSMPTAY